MIFKPPVEPQSLKILRCLKPRIILSKTNNRYLRSLKKGYQGEKKFAALLNTLGDNCIVLHDLLLEYNHSIFQIDSLLITEGVVYLFEVKNYEGDFYFDSGHWFKENGKEIKDPMIQLKRSESMLRQLFTSMKINYQIKSYIIFVHPEFTLLQAPRNIPIILPTQLKRFFQRLHENTDIIKKSHEHLAKKLLDMHIEEHPYTKLPHYNYEQLKKGIICNSCHSVMLKVVKKNVVCNQCGQHESTSSAVLRNIQEFQLLFPEHQITTHIIHEWCGKLLSKKIIRKVLTENFTCIPKGRSTYYIHSPNTIR
ncbi:NERD domain-containing protein [Cerasibacillus terrae]|uniref:NERD domain-containing protein n=1 Tax=Cerasibacillus terrae TaxID=2498845 RepID=A0A5C8NZQ4_9BACI|nr:nuclease-related domain-containing protein [Cerasibacillus terrae]TXL66563.1 NERD domain-containing protein [Cerasibacillus terrae]